MLFAACKQISCSKYPSNTGNVTICILGLGFESEEILYQ